MQFESESPPPTLINAGDDDPDAKVATGKFSFYGTQSCDGYGDSLLCRASMYTINQLRV